MFLKENFIKLSEHDTKLWNWGQVESYQLKHKYTNPHASEVVTYKLNKEELEKLLNKIYK